MHISLASGTCRPFVVALTLHSSRAKRVQVGGGGLRVAIVGKLVVCVCKSVQKATLNYQHYTNAGAVDAVSRFLLPNCGAGELLSRVEATRIAHGFGSH